MICFKNTEKTLIGTYCHRELEILKFEEIPKERGYENSMYMINASKQDVYDNVSLTIRYKSSIVKFNELQDVSWFVNFGKK